MYVKVSTIAAQYDISAKSVRRICAEMQTNGVPGVYHIGRCVRIQPEEFERYLKAREKK